MRNLYSLSIFILLMINSQASAYPCPADLEQVANKLTLHNWISRFVGIHSLPGCTLEIRACDRQEPRSENQLLAEIYIVDSQNREVYLPMIVVPIQNPKIDTEMEIYSKNFYYLKRDKFYESEFGRTETYRLGISLNRDSSAIKTLDLGTYSTYKALRNRPDGNQSVWYNCGLR